jgi:ABC-type transporter Mla MlaB component
MKNQITIAGQFSREAALSWKQKLNDMATANSGLEIDMTGVTDADITGINALATTQKLLSKNEQKLKIKVKNNSELAKLLGYTKLGAYMEVQFVN